MRWRAPAGRPGLTGTDVHVWSAPLRVPSRVRRAMRSLLAADEIAKADRIVVPEKREQSVVSRGTLRRLLGLYTGTDPSDLAFEYSKDGRPSLVDDESAIEFNVTHSGDLLLVAMTRRGVLGVDVELVRDDIDHSGVGERFFSPAERKRLARAVDPHAAFFRCWTRKEALLKARGTGLMTPLHQFDVTLLSDEVPRVVATRFEPPERRRWTLIHLRPHRSYVGALCLEGPARRVRGLRYNSE